MNEKLTEETDKAVVEQITSKIMRHTVQFLSSVGGRPTPFGTGVFAKIYDDYFIITASHVASFFEEHPNEDLRIRVTKDSFINVIGEVNYTNIEKSEGKDLAYIKLDKQIIVPILKAYLPLTIDKFRHHNDLLFATNYCVLGFPAVNVTKAGEPFNTGAQFYLTKPTNDKPYQFYRLTKKDFIILEMNGKGTDVKTNKRGKINTKLHGISGCGLWFFLIYIHPTTAKITVDYRLVGIMTNYRNGRHFCVIANKIWSIIEAFKDIENFKFKEKVVKDLVYENTSY